MLSIEKTLEIFKIESTNLRCFDFRLTKQIKITYSIMMVAFKG